MRLDLTIITDNYRKILILVFIALIAIFMAMITSNLIEIATAKEFTLNTTQDNMFQEEAMMFRAGKNLDFYAPITDRNIFDSQNRQPNESRPSRSAQIDVPERPSYSAPVKSSMSANLVGTMVFSDPAYSFARINRGSGDAENFYTGDSLYGEATVKKIERNRVYIMRDERMEYLEIEGPRASVMPSYAPVERSIARPLNSAPVAEISSEDVRSLGENKYMLNRKMVDSLLSNYNAVLTQARAVPNFQDGKANGFKVFAIQKNSIYDVIGIKNGDVLTRVNGGDINSLEKVLTLFTQLRNESAISIDLERGGQKMTMEYEIR